ncbi:MAG: hypothetical protein LBO73_01090 [Holosporaceae bacterium]|jgi:hypothetical protein|nr:hypothetical protein [Holosporaceae bacterium]
MNKMLKIIVTILPLIVCEKAVCGFWGNEKDTKDLLAAAAKVTELATNCYEVGSKAVDKLFEHASTKLKTKRDNFTAICALRCFAWAVMDLCKWMHAVIKNMENPYDKIMSLGRGKQDAALNALLDAKCAHLFGNGTMALLANAATSGHLFLQTVKTLDFDMVSSAGDVTKQVGFLCKAALPARVALLETIPALLKKAGATLPAIRGAGLQIVVDDLRVIFDTIAKIGSYYTKKEKLDPQEADALIAKLARARSR